MNNIFIYRVLLLLLLLNIKYKNITIVGQWKSIDNENEYYYIFNEDKTCSYKMPVARLNCTYEDDGEKLTITFKGKETPITYRYQIDKGVLIIKDISGKENKFVKTHLD